MKTNLDILGMSDEEFSKLPGPPSEEVVEETPAPESKETGEGEVENTETVPAQDNSQVPVEAPASEEPAGNEDPEKEEEPAEGNPPPADAKDAFKASGEQKPEEKKDEQKPTEDKPKETPAVDYEAFYKLVMAPFKANGKTIQLSSAEEAVQLMQMGANYTRKMQEISKYKKQLLMLENNGLLDEDKLSFLIDLDRKDPEAIKKLLKDGDIDPIDVDTSTESQYKGGSHRVSDREVAFQSAIDDLKVVDGGLETIQSINSQWDQASKEELWNRPQLFQVIHNHRKSGIYDRIVSEVDRQRTLGQIPVSTPFLQAYQFIGDRMLAAGLFGPTQPATQAPASAGGRTPVAVGPASSTKPKQDNQKVRAAAPTRTATTRVVEKEINPLALSDEEFIKRMNGKV